MVLEQLKCYWRSKFNILLIILPIIGLLPGIRRDYAEKQEFVQALGNAVSNTDIEYLTMMVQSFTGLYSFERLFFLNTAFFLLFWMILMIGMGIHIGGQTFTALQSGYGNNIMVRMEYKNYIRKTLLAQFIYLFMFFCCLFIIIFIGCLLLGGGGLQVPYISSLRKLGQDYGPVLDISISRYLFILFGLALYSIICMIPLILISSLSPVFLKNKYIIQFLPILILVGGYMFGFLFGNISRTLSYIMRQFIFEHALTNLTMLISPNIAPIDGSVIESIIYVILYPFMLITLFFILYKMNINKLGKDYLL
ncbi:MAG: hypothetical protein HFH49_16405 [Lachnospiraceae bacterium]|nr:hypothetical protein [Lachnospiraceae bacterium]